MSHRWRSHRDRSRARWSAEWSCYALLVVVPLAGCAIAALSGWPIASGDNIVQNYPLRVLVGEALRAGALPLYDPYQWAGTQLLGGMNAAAAFPLTWIYAVVPGIAAWVATEALSASAAALGLFVFLRHRGIGRLSGLLGACSFSFVGYLAAQADHIDVVQVGACLAWSVAALERIGERGSNRLAWAGLLALCIAGFALVGSPETAFYAVVGVVLYALYTIGRSPGARVRTGALIAGAGVLGALDAAVQLLTGERFVEVSQRSSATYAYLTSGSLSPHELALQLAPDVLGGGGLTSVAFSGSYNLGELYGYPGVLALSAVVGLATRLHRPEGREWRIWYVIGVVGIVLALGSSTPLPHVLLAIPVVRISRLPSRAYLLFALSCSVLLAYFCDRSLRAPLVAHAEPRANGERGVVLGALVAPAAVIGFLVALAAGGSASAFSLTGHLARRWTLGAVEPYMIAAGAVALVAGAYVVLAPRLGRRPRTVFLGAVVGLDLCFSFVCQPSYTPTSVTKLETTNPLRTELARAVGPSGRFVMYDPHHQGRAAAGLVGKPNLDDLDAIVSAQGYTSLTWRPYATATGTHGVDTALPSAFSTTVFDTLDVRALLALPSAFRTPVHGRVGPPSKLGPGRTVRYFAGAVALASVRLEAVGDTSPDVLARLAASVRLLRTSGPVHGSVPTVSRGAGGATASFTGAPRAVGVAITNGARAPVRVRIVVETAQHDRFAPVGDLAADVVAPHWVESGTIGPYALFADTRARDVLEAEQLSDTSAARGVTISVRSSSPYTGEEVIAVRAHAPFRLVRAVPDIPGWSVRVAAHGRSVPAVLARDGLVQSVALPAGAFVVTFVFTPPGFAAGLALSLLGVAATLALFGLAVVARSRRARRARDPAVRRATLVGAARS